MLFPGKRMGERFALSAGLLWLDALLPTRLLEGDLSVIGEGTIDHLRVLKRWSVDTNMSMRDSVAKAIDQAMPPEYLQEYTRCTETGNASKNPS